MNNIGFLSEIFQFLKMKFSIYLNRRVFVMTWETNLHFPLCFPIHQTSELGSTLYSKRKEFAPWGSKFFLLKVDPISEGR